MLIDIRPDPHERTPGLAGWAVCAGDGQPHPGRRARGAQSRLAAGATGHRQLHARVRGQGGEGRTHRTGRALTEGEKSRLLSTCALDPTAAGVRDAAVLGLGPAGRGGPPAHELDQADGLSLQPGITASGHTENPGQCI